jgi:hypothetical protein
METNFEANVRCPVTGSGSGPQPAAAGREPGPDLVSGAVASSDELCPLLTQSPSHGRVPVPLAVPGESLPG